MPIYEGYCHRLCIRSDTGQQFLGLGQREQPGETWGHHLVRGADRSSSDYNAFVPAVEPRGPHRAMAIYLCGNTNLFGSHEVRSLRIGAYRWRHQPPPGASMVVGKTTSFRGHRMSGSKKRRPSLVPGGRRGTSGFPNTRVGSLLLATRVQGNFRPWRMPRALTCGFGLSLEPRVFWNAREPNHRGAALCVLLHSRGVGCGRRQPIAPCSPTNFFCVWLWPLNCLTSRW